MSQSNIRLPPKWIELNITKRECTTFLATSGDDTLCQCGRRKIDHGDFVKHQHRPEKWSPALHTRQFKTDAYGTILFEGDHHPNKAHYVRLANDTNPDLILQMMTYVWNLEMPQLLITIRGGSTSNFEMPPRLGRIFQMGIIKAARSTNAWVFSNGLNSGAARHLGIALGNEKWLGGPRRGKVVSVGIAPWGMVENMQDLLGRNKERTYSPLDHAQSNFIQLNPRHSNFLLVDNGSIGKFGGENNLRRRLEKCVASYPTSPNRSCETPVIAVVLEGGFYTLRQVCDYLYDEPPVPVVVFGGSGRAADLISWALRKIETEEEYEEMQEKIIQRIAQLFAINNESHCLILYEQLRRIYLMKGLVNIFNPYSPTDEEFDSVILSSIFRSQHWTPLQQLSLTLVWNRVDIAETEVFFYGRDWSRDHLEHAMMEALVSDRMDFVTLLLEHGLNLQSFLTATRLEALYSLERMPSKLMRNLLTDLSKLNAKRQQKKKENDSHSPQRNLTLHDIGIILSHMIGHVFKSSYIHIVAKSHKLRGGTADEHEIRAQTFPQPFDDLFVWAVLTKRHEMSKLLWRHGKGSLAKALIAVKLNKYMAVEINAQERTFTNLASDFEKYAEEWESLSLSLLDSCYRSNSKMARQLLTMELECWSKQTCLALAVMANHRTLLGHPCCQMLLADLWMGALNIKSHHGLKIMLGVIFPPCALFWEYKSTEELKLLPHQDRAGYAIEGLFTGHHDSHGHGKHAAGGDQHGMTTPSLMTLLLQTKTSSYIQDAPEKFEPHVQQERTTDLAEVVKNIFPPKENYVDIPAESNQQERHHYHHHLHIHPLQGLHMKQADNVCYETDNNQHYKLKGVRASEAEAFMSDNNQNSFVTTQHSLSLWSKFIEFQNAPVTNFYRHTMAYIFFIIALAYVILYPQDPKSPGWTECYVLAYMVTHFLECIREFIQIDALSFSEKVEEIQQSVWQFGDIVVVSAFLFCAVVLRFTPGYFEYGMLLYRLSSIYWNLRLYKYLGVHRFLGPKIVMMKKMLKHMVHFAMIIVIVIISFGLAREAIRFPNEAPSVHDIAEAFLEPYMMMFGEVDMDFLSLTCRDDDANTKDDDRPECPTGHWIVPIAWVMYMLVSNILIINVLIAVFNGIYEEVDSIAVEVWMFQRFDFVMEFEQKPNLPPPLIIICHLCSFLKFIYNRFFTCLCDEELLLESQMDEELHPHIIMGNDHSLKSFLSPGEQCMVFDFEDENLESLAPLLEKETGNSNMGTAVVSGSMGSVVGLTASPYAVSPNNINAMAEATGAAFRQGPGNDRFAIQQIKLVVGELHAELESQRVKIDRLINNFEIERERDNNEENEKEERNDTDSANDRRSTVRRYLGGDCNNVGPFPHGISCVAGMPISTESSLDEFSVDSDSIDV